MNHQQSRARNRAAFTLIELLVVITIIVTLLALLTPALDRAIYQAELAVCGTHLKGIATGATLYASANRRAYPKRIPANGEYHAGLLNYGPYDLRKALKDYMSIKMFVDPLCGGIDLELDPRSADPDTPVAPGSTLVFANYQYYAGWTFNGFPGMTRLGDRFESWIDPASTTDTHRFNIIAGDRDEWQTNVVTASHPDDKGLMVLWAVQNVPNPWLPALPGTGTYTVSWWQNLNAPDRGAMDLNFALDDGSVALYNKVEMEAPQTMGRVPEYNDNALYTPPPGRWVHLPLR